MKQDDERKRSKGGRKPKKDPAVFRYSISLNEVENARFLAMFEASGMKVKAHYITACIFDRPVKVVKIDKAMLDYYTRLTTFYAQFRSIGVNYNQIVKALNTHYTEQKALGAIYNLEKLTIKLVELNQKIVALSNEFHQKWLQK
ncbi:conjugal transfer protein MobA [Flavobacterium sp. UBA4197]|uniref:conjugal transfer protein MobA n=1 Tax=Flavobacterium sp. UBA4197 TaxID=1946546 RepID=UPI00257EBE38|nr:conjugal transfer protein MobA [Flavobacterium sp. UBA4197]